MAEAVTEPVEINHPADAHMDAGGPTTEGGSDLASSQQHIETPSECVLSASLFQNLVGQRRHGLSTVSSMSFPS
jgi:hypothetical protein